MSWQQKLKSWRRGPLFDRAMLSEVESSSGSGSDCSWAGGGEWERAKRSLEALLPQRPPMLLLDEIRGVNLAARQLVARRTIGADHLGLAGHFPGEPVLPGAMTIEMMGQAGVALFQLLMEQEGLEKAAGVRATKIFGAHFLGAIRPGDEVEILVEALEWDSFLGECRAQALVNAEVRAVMAGEVMVL